MLVIGVWLDHQEATRRGWKLTIELRQTVTRN